MLLTNIENIENRQKFRLLLASVLTSLASFLSQANAFFPFGNPLLGLISLIPLLWALRHSPNNRWASLILGLSLALSSPLQYFWLASFQDYSTWTIGSVTLGFWLYGWTFGPALRLALRQEPGPAVFLGAMVWALYEFLRSNGFLGFPWGNLPYPFYDWQALIQATDWGGTTWISFLIASWMILAMIWSTEPENRSKLTHTALSFSLIVLVHFTYASWTTEVEYDQKGRLKVLLIQQNADPWVRGQEALGLETSVRLSVEGLQRHPDTDLVVWSENSLRRPLQIRKFYEENPKDRPLFDVIRGSNQHWLFGNPYIADQNATRIMNAAILMGPNTNILEVYGKNHLVPIAEFIPFFEWPPIRDFFRNTVGLQATWVPNDRISPLTLRSSTGQEIRLGVQICFEDAFPYISRSLSAQGAKLFIVLSNDSWSKTDSAQIQHFLVALFRALETRTPMIRSTNSGFTGAVDPRGKIVAGPLPFFEPGWLYHDLKFSLERPYTPLSQLLGDWVGWLFWWLTVFFLAMKGGAFRSGLYSYFAKRLRWSSSSSSGR